MKLKRIDLKFTGRFKVVFKFIIKKLILIVLSILFFALGIIGLVLPIIPQVPFFILSLICIVLLSKRLYHKVVGSRFYINKCIPHIRKHKFLTKIDSLARKIVEGG